MKIELKRGDLELHVEFSDTDIKEFKLKSAGKVREFLRDLQIHALDLGTPVAAPPVSGSAIGFQHEGQEG